MTAKTERAAAIRWIRAEMADYGLTMEELEAAGGRAGQSKEFSRIR